MNRFKKFHHLLYSREPNRRAKKVKTIKNILSITFSLYDNFKQKFLNLRLFNRNFMNFTKIKIDRNSKYANYFSSIRSLARFYIFVPARNCSRFYFFVHSLSKVFLRQTGFIRLTASMLNEFSRAIENKFS